MADTIHGSLQHLKVGAYVLTSHISGEISHTPRNTPYSVQGLGQNAANKMSPVTTWGFSFQMFYNTVTEAWLTLWRGTPKQNFEYGPRGNTSGVPKETAGAVIYADRQPGGNTGPQTITITIIPDDSGAGITYGTF